MNVSRGAKLNAMKKALTPKGAREKQETSETIRTLYQRKIEALPKIKRVTKDQQRQQILPGLQIGKQLALL